MKSKYFHSLLGCSTPPRSNNTYEQLSANLSFSQLFHQSKILTSDELQRRLHPMNSSFKKHRHHRIRKDDCIVPLQQNHNMPVVLQKLFDNQDESSTMCMSGDDYLAPISSSMFSVLSSKLIHPQPNSDCFVSNSVKKEQETLFSIPETTMRKKLKSLLQKN